MGDKPSLLLIAHTYAIDEHARKLTELARHFDLTCATVRRGDLGTLYGIAGERFGTGQTGLNYERVELPARGSVASVTRFILSGLRSVIRRRHWDFVLVENEPWAWLKWQALLACRLGGSVRRYGEFTWENVRRPGLKGCVLRKVYELSARWLDFWICGNMAAGAIVRDAGMAENRVLICPQVGVELPHPVPLSADQKREFRRAEGLPGKAFIVGFGGRLVEEKGILDLVRAIEMLPESERGGETGVHLALKGHGCLRDELVRKSKDARWLHVLDPVPHHDLPRFLGSLDLLILGSHPVNGNGICWEEQFGHILVEGMAAGCLAAGSSSGAIPEVIDDSEMIFPIENSAAICALIRKVRSDDEFSSAKRARQMKRLQEHFTHAAVADRLADFLINKLS